MNSFELNKVAGAVLGTLLFAFGTGFLAELIYTPKPAGNAGYALPGGSEGGEHGAAAPAGGGETAAPKGEGIAALLASADAEKGKAGTKACQACHSFEKGGPNKVGPDLWEVVGRKKGSHEGFGYSEAMKAKGGEWGYEELDHFLTKPSEYVKGTKMSYQGISAAPERANVIAYLRTLADTPKPLPAAEKKEEPKKDDAKPAEGDKKAEGEKKPDAKAVEPEKKAEEAKPVEGEKKAEGEKKPDAKATEPAKAEEAKPSEAKPAEKAAEPEQKPVEAKPDGDKKAEDAKPAESEKKAEDTKPAEGDKPAEKPTEEKPAQP
ncbi:c-type cytochrome [Methylobacterium haplocladii]|uniref:Cytochrome c domain-containing protein n=1 Tax=Methylobacterium haplocladii TaxID=1176176 RepID=A0A512IPU3_9HYPH|nr:cytochrome c family protein [Methylobacterium haplocladii]GEO99724.1 hypothetical protein MHA02_21120 [Methylobacterium haplocladii]GJD84643.1 hypothetical protein HPGCJGGD_2523 [Methylobacterium haplocladii]GLS58651.1 hypothetical protein GCM10007887_13150 [Methylobacterium haplocladii]